MNTPIIVRILSLVLLCGFASGCGKPVLSESKAEQTFRDHVQKEAGGRAKLVSFKKVNGSHGVDDGIPFASISFEATIEYTEECWGNSPLDASDVISIATLPWSQLANKSNIGNRQIKKNERQNLKGSYYFMKGDNGWDGMLIELKWN